MSGKHISPEGRERLSAEARRRRPWEHNTGPKTVEGKARSRMNALKHGKDVAEKRAFQRAAIRFIKVLVQVRRDAAYGGMRGPVWLEARCAELAKLSSRITASLPKQIEPTDSPVV